jgi:hypothetical protein
VYQWEIDGVKCMPKSGVVGPKTSPFDGLPPELAQNAIEFLDNKSLANLNVSSKESKYLTDGQVLREKAQSEAKRR